MKKIREFAPADRYVYDFGLCSYKNGFAQVDTQQDASYFGTWANPEKLIIFNYCEGDCCTTVCDTPEEFRAELIELAEWNVKSGYRRAKIDCMTQPEMMRRFVAIGLESMLH